MIHIDTSLYLCYSGHDYKDLLKKKKKAEVQAWWYRPLILAPRRQRTDF